MTSDRPFVLLDDARPGGRAVLYSEPAGTIETRDPGELRDCLRRLEGRRAAGFLAYEAGYALEPRLAEIAPPLADDAPPLLWFGLFDRAESVDASDWLPDPAGAQTRSRVFAIPGQPGASEMTLTYDVRISAGAPPGGASGSRGDLRRRRSISAPSTRRRWGSPRR